MFVKRFKSGCDLLMRRRPPAATQTDYVAVEFSGSVQYQGERPGTVHGNGAPHKDENV